MYTAVRHFTTIARSSEESGLRSLLRPDVPRPAVGMLVADRYQLLRKIGEGGMACVWLAHDCSLERDCAVKLLDARYIGNRDLVARFESEAKTTALLGSSHVVGVFDHGVWRGLPFITMEHIAGETLRNRLTRLGRLDPMATYRIVAHVARGLACAHAAGVVHRDLKPSNVLLTRSEDGELAKLIDFGVAADSRFENTAPPPGQVIGTPAYMSPEQARGLVIDWRSDLWALGALAFECLTGRMLFESEGVTNVTNKILYQSLPKLSDVAPELPAALDAWFEKALARDREQRFQSAKELADAFASTFTAPALLNVADPPPRPCDSTDAPATTRDLAPPTRPEGRRSAGSHGRTASRLLFFTTLAALLLSHWPI